MKKSIVDAAIIGIGSGAVALVSQLVKKLEIEL